MVALNSFSLISFHDSFLTASLHVCRFYRHLVRLNSGNGDALDEESVDYETITRSRLNSANSRLGCVVLMR